MQTSTANYLKHKTHADMQTSTVNYLKHKTHADMQTSTVNYLKHKTSTTKLYRQHTAGLINLFQPKDRLAERDTEQGPPPTPPQIWACYSYHLFELGVSHTHPHSPPNE